MRTPYASASSDGRLLTPLPETDSQRYLDLAKWFVPYNSPLHYLNDTALFIPGCDCFVMFHKALSINTLPDIRRLSIPM